MSRNFESEIYAAKIKFSILMAEENEREFYYSKIQKGFDKNIVIHYTIDLIQKAYMYLQFTGNGALAFV